jgi:hypothetical protein
MNYYAGIGSRETPHVVQSTMHKIAAYLWSQGWTLRSGGARGADSAFESGCGSDLKDIYLPWKRFENNTSPLYTLTPEAFEMAAKYHPTWDRLGDAARKFMARNCYQVLGQTLDVPSKMIICWTRDGQASGGTGQALRIAADYDIPIFNLYHSHTLPMLRTFVGL